MALLPNRTEGKMSLMCRPSWKSTSFQTQTRPCQHLSSPFPIVRSFSSQDCHVQPSARASGCAAKTKNAAAAAAKATSTSEVLSQRDDTVHNLEKTFIPASSI